MIRLTSFISGKAISVNPELIKVVIEDENFTYIHFGPDENCIKVSETREEVARKVMEWKYIMQKGAYTNTQEMARLRELAGLEDTNND